MTLFAIEKEKDEQYDVFDLNCRLIMHSSFLDTYRQLKEKGLNLLPGECINIWCKGKWSLHQLMKVLLLIAGPSDLYFSTWAIQETAVRELMILKDEGIVKNIYAVFDYKIKDRKSSAFLLSEKNFTTIALAKCHAKVSVIWNDHYRLSVLSSANWTRNPRWERYSIIRDDDTAAADKTMIEKIINGSV